MQHIRLNFCISILPNIFCHFNDFTISEMVVPKVDEKLFEELKTMGFSEARATRALHYSSQWYMHLLYTHMFLIPLFLLYLMINATLKLQLHPILFVSHRLRCPCRKYQSWRFYKLDRRTWKWHRYWPNAFGIVYCLSFYFDLFWFTSECTCLDFLIDYCYHYYAYALLISFSFIKIFISSCLLIYGVEHKLTKNLI